MFTKKMACLSVVALSAVCLLALPGVGRADIVADWYPGSGTVTTWTSTSGDTGDYFVPLLTTWLFRVFGTVVTAP